MKTLITLILLAPAACTAWADEWKLIWSDEFNESGLPNAARWNYDSGAVYNNERQLYTRAEGKRPGGRRQADHRGAEGTVG